MATRTSIATDNFDDGALGSDWANLYTGFGTVSVSGTSATGSATQTEPGRGNVARWVGAGTFTNDHYSMATYGTLSNAGTARMWSVLARASADTAGNRDFYVASITDNGTDGGSHTWTLSSVKDGSYAALATTSRTSSSNGTIAIECEGNPAVLRVYHNGTQVTALDYTDSSSPLTTGLPGIGVTSGKTIDNWEGGSLASDVTAPTYDAGPSVTANTGTTVSVSATATDAVASTVDHYVGIYADGSTPTAAQIKAGSGTGWIVKGDTLAVANGAAATMDSPLAGLSGSTAYDAWFTVEEAGGGNLATATKVDFTTMCVLSSPLGTMDATTGPTGNTCSGGVTVTGTTGNWYWYVSASATPPSVADLKAGTSSLDFSGAIAISSAGAKTFTGEGSLAEKTNYYVHYVVNQNSQDSAISTSAAFQATDSPTLSSATGVQVGVTNAATLSVATNRAAVGTLWTVVTTAVTQPSTTQIKAGQNHLGAAATFAASDASVTNPQTFNATPLSAGSYFAHFYQEDAGSDGSNRITTSSFTISVAGVYNIGTVSPATLRPGLTATVSISGDWSGSGMSATVDGHAVTLTSQSVSSVTFVVPTLHTDAAFTDTQYGIPIVFQLTDGGETQTKNITLTGPSGYDFVNIATVGGIWADDTGAAIGDDHLGHWTVGTSDAITTAGVLDNITGYPATYVYWRFDESDGAWTSQATETFYEVVAFDGPDYAVHTYYEGVAITTFDATAGFNVATADISSYAVSSGALPTGLSLNTSTGAITGTPTTQGEYTFVITATDSDSNTADSNSVVWTIHETPVWSGAPSAQTWSNGQVITPIDLSLLINANGYGPAASYAHSAGSFPSGITLNTSTGVISGTVGGSASASSPYAGQDFTATNTAGTGAMPGTFTITVNPVAPIASGTLTQPSMTVGVATTSYDAAALFTGGTVATYTLSGVWPAGLAIHATTGAITGTPTTAGSYTSCAVTGTNANGAATTNTVTISVANVRYSGTVAAQSSARGSAITPLAGSTGFVGTSLTYDIVGGLLPPGLSINSSTGSITGTPTTVGVYSLIQIRATKSGTQAVSNAFTWTITAVALAPQLTHSVGNRRWTEDVAHLLLIADYFSETPTSYAHTGGTLPTGMAFDTTTGVLSGTPTTVQTRTGMIFTATNATGTTATDTFVIDIVAATAGGGGGMVRSIVR